MKEWFEAEFPPQKITLEELQQFVGMLHRSGLVIADVPGQGKQLHERRLQRRNKEMLGAMSNILCIRFKGFDPERLLNWLYPKVRFLFGKTVLRAEPGADDLGLGAGGRPVRRVPLEAAELLPVLQSAQRHLAGDRSRR